MKHALAVLALASAFPAAAQEYVTVATSVVRLAPDPQGYIVHFHNDSTNSEADNRAYDLRHEAMHVIFQFKYTHGDDGVAVFPPDGWVCEPQSCELWVSELGEGSMLIYPLGRVGM